MAGPPWVSWLRGSSQSIHIEAPRMLLEWAKEYGEVFKFHTALGANTMYVGDLKGAAHVFAHYERTPFGRNIFRFFLGQGSGEALLTVEGATHRQQNPAFGTAELRKQTEVFVSKSNELVLIWKDILANSTRTDGGATIDAFSWLNKVALDIIAIAGFNYDTNSLHATKENPNELNTAARSLFDVSVSDPLFILQMVFPIFRFIPSQRMRVVRDAQNTIRRIGMRLIAEKKAAAASSATSASSVRKNDIEGSDLLSLLIKANIATDLPERSRMSDEDILAQVPTFMVAGHETTATVTTWGLFALSLAPRAQARLRDELRTIDTDTPTMDELNGLSYLGMVVREILRLYPPAGATERYAPKDDVIPLDKPYTDKHGKVHHEIIVSKGDAIHIPYHSLQLSEEIWGHDAGEFRPERWESVPETAKQLPAVWGNLPVFAAGPHACIGYRFALVEIKALLFAIVRAFSLRLAVSPSEVTRKTVVVMRPVLSTDPEKGPQLPLTIQAVEA
ncbi:cytochrome P450 [Vararia minispora EC-137]|uniref:Cytochrome P450 n=1 Tax=Vararia minispora EC-137 TaxID=1314806 RepID=A0ACB8QN00_9AGAM|nr:cytochrome P450 [Vararia minispora EC-137]